MDVRIGAISVGAAVLGALVGSVSASILNFYFGRKHLRLSVMFEAYERLAETVSSLTQDAVKLHVEVGEFDLDETRQRYRGELAKLYQEHLDRRGLGVEAQRLADWVDRDKWLVTYGLWMKLRQEAIDARMRMVRCHNRYAMLFPFLRGKIDAMNEDFDKWTGFVKNDGLRIAKHLEGIERLSEPVVNEIIAHIQDTGMKVLEGADDIGRTLSEELASSLSWAKRRQPFSSQDPARQDRHRAPDRGDG
jgi:hypothetical protein